MSHSHAETERGSSTAVLMGAVVVLVLAIVLIAFMFGAFDRGGGGGQVVPGTGGGEVVPGTGGGTDGGGTGGGAAPKSMLPTSVTPGYVLI
jgi:hypothetical protein